MTTAAAPDTDSAVARLTLGLPQLDPVALANFRDNLALALAGGLAPATIRALHSDGRRFAAWCRRHGLGWLPAAPATVATFLQEMAATGRNGHGYRPASLDRFAFSIRTWHLLAELEPPTRSTKVKMVRKAHARQVGRGQRQADALTKDRLDAILQCLDDEIAELEDAERAEATPGGAGGTITPPSARRRRRLAALRDRALLLTGYCILARGGELLALRWSDIHSDGRGGTVATIRRSKTDQDGLGADQHLWPTVVAALAAWRAAHDGALAAQRRDEAERVGALHGARFRPRLRRHPTAQTPSRPVRLLWSDTTQVFRGLVPARVGPAPPRGEADRRDWQGWPPTLSLTSLNAAIAARARQAALPPGRYSSHSLRIGAAQDLLAAGKSLPAIMQDGRWKSPQMVLRYVRRLVAGRGAMAEWGREVDSDNA